MAHADVYGQAIAKSFQATIANRQVELSTAPGASA